MVAGALPRTPLRHPRVGPPTAYACNDRTLRPVPLTLVPDCDAQMVTLMQCANYSANANTITVVSETTAY